jgi:hypothetical protein
MPRGRPPKPEEDRKTVDLRIPVTPEQKEIVAEAMRLEKTEMAGWARELLLAAAEKIIAEAKNKKPKK